MKYLLVPRVEGRLKEQQSTEVGQSTSLKHDHRVTTHRVEDPENAIETSFDVRI
jgi:hypothetical protein